MTESAYWLILIYTWLHFLTHMHARMTSWYMRTENFDQLAHRQRITSSETSIVSAGSRNSAESVQMLRPIEVFAAVFFVEPSKNWNHDCFLYHNFSNFISVCSHNSRRVKRSLSVLCIRAFWSVVVDVIPNFVTMHNVSDRDWSDCVDA